MPVKLVGRTTDFKGKSLWEILANLKNFGVGRIIVRNRFQRYPEPCYMKVLKVGAMALETGPEARPYEERRKVMVLAERVWRGKKDKGIVQLDSATYKDDYLLIPKDQEYKYHTLEKFDERILPRTMEFPPLMKELLARQFKAKDPNYNQEPEMPVVYNLRGNKMYRIAEEGETPTEKLTIGLGKPANPSLYANCKPI